MYLYFIILNDKYAITNKIYKLNFIITLDLNLKSKNKK